MRTIGQALFALLAALCLLCTVPGCEVVDLLGDDDSSSSGNPTPDDITGAALAPKPAQSLENSREDIHCPGSFSTFKKIVKKSSKNPGTGHQWHHIVNQNPQTGNGSATVCTLLHGTR